MRTGRKLAWVLTIAVLLTTPLWAQEAEAPAAPETPTLQPAPPEGETPAASPEGAPEGTVGDDGAEGDEVDQDQRKSPGSGWTFPVILIGGFLLLYFWMGRGRRKQESKRREMLSNLKKGDRVTSIGGIVGTVMEVREDEVVAKVDETNNVRMHFARWAIRGIGEDGKQENPADKR